MNPWKLMFIVSTMAAPVLADIRQKMQLGGYIALISVVASLLVLLWLCKKLAAHANGNKNVCTSPTAAETTSRVRLLNRLQAEQVRKRTVNSASANKTSDEIFDSLKTRLDSRCVSKVSSDISASHDHGLSKAHDSSSDGTSQAFKKSTSLITESIYDKSDAATANFSVQEDGKITVNRPNTSHSGAPYPSNISDDELAESEAVKPEAKNRSTVFKFNSETGSYEMINSDSISTKIVDQVPPPLSKIASTLLNGMNEASFAAVMNESDATATENESTLGAELFEMIYFSMKPSETVHGPHKFSNLEEGIPDASNVSSSTETMPSIQATATLPVNKVESPTLDIVDLDLTPAKMVDRVSSRCSEIASAHSMLDESLLNVMLASDTLTGSTDKDSVHKMANFDRVSSEKLSLVSPQLSDAEDNKLNFLNDISSVETRGTVTEGTVEMLKLESVDFDAVMVPKILKLSEIATSELSSLDETTPVGALDEVLSAEMNVGPVINVRDDCAARMSMPEMVNFDAVPTKPLNLVSVPLVEPLASEINMVNENVSSDDADRSAKVAEHTIEMSVLKMVEFDMTSANQTLDQIPEKPIETGASTLNTLNEDLSPDLRDITDEINDTMAEGAVMVPVIEMVNFGANSKTVFDQAKSHFKETVTSALNTSEVPISKIETCEADTLTEDAYPNPTLKIVDSDAHSITHNNEVPPRLSEMATTAVNTSNANSLSEDKNQFFLNIATEASQVVKLEIERVNLNASPTEVVDWMAPELAEAATPALNALNESLDYRSEAAAPVANRTAGLFTFDNNSRVQSADSREVPGWVSRTVANIELKLKEAVEDDAIDDTPKEVSTIAEHIKMAQSGNESILTERTAVSRMTELEIEDKANDSGTLLINENNMDSIAVSSTKGCPIEVPSILPNSSDKAAATALASADHISEAPAEYVKAESADENKIRLPAAVSSTKGCPIEVPNASALSNSSDKAVATALASADPISETPAEYVRAETADKNNIRLPAVYATSKNTHEDDTSQSETCNSCRVQFTNVTESQISKNAVSGTGASSPDWLTVLESTFNSRTSEFEDGAPKMSEFGRIPIEFLYPCLPKGTDCSNKESK